MRKLMIGLGAAFALAVVGAAAFFLVADPAPERQRPQALVKAGSEIGGPFRLTDQTGTERTAEDVIDGPTLVYFGYTWCPDICPIDVAVMTEAVDRLGENGVEVEPVFITVDPERDTPEALAEFAEAMHPDLTALTGTEEQIREAAQAYKAFYARQPPRDPARPDEYLVNHSGFFYLMTPEGLAALYRNRITPADLAADVAFALGRDWPREAEPAG